MGAGISGGGPPWAHEAWGRAQGVGHALHPRGQVDAPCCVLSAKYSQIFQKKSYLNFRAFGEILFSGYFYIAWISQETDRKILFYFISTKEQKI